MPVTKLEPKEVVESFILDLKRILVSPNFNVNLDLDILLKKNGENPLDPFTTENTLAALDYDKNDVRNQLLSITVSDYIETIVDNKNACLPSFYTFCQEIQKRDIYMKIKIRDRTNGKVFCVSFHFARYAISKPLPYET